MIDLSPDTEALARRLAEAQSLSVDQTVRQALEARERIVPKRRGKDVSPAAVAARIARVDAIVKEIAALPILDPRPVEEIVDDLNAL